MAATILIVEDHDVLRQSLRVWLEFAFPECHIIETANEQQAAALAIAHSPEIMIVDLRPTNGEVFAPVVRLSTAAPASKIVVLTDHTDAVHRAHALKSGASFFVNKMAILAQLRPVLTTILHQGNGVSKPRQEMIQKGSVSPPINKFVD